MSNKIQQQFLDSLVVERVSAFESASVLLDGFRNETNSGLSNYLTDNKKAKLDDSNNANAVYIISTSDKTLELLRNEMNLNFSQNFILLYFALRPGLLYEPLFTENQLLETLNMHNFVADYISESNTERRQEMAEEYLKQHPRMTLDEVEALISDYGQNIELRIKNLTSPNRHSASPQIDHASSTDNHKRVDSTVGAIELFLFCANQSPCVKDLYEKLCFGYPMGCLLYWYFIFPIVLSAVDIVSGQYVYLFAADNNINTNMERTLVGYYEQYLNFTTNPGLYTVKPMFDCGCVFMWQEINAVKDYYLDLRQGLLRDTASDSDAILI